ncbi:hypothetical protein [Halobacteriovorax sp. HLS]|uniref:hypothetical protein n=1 Tax=Halobacteriovorax sp. HLS TaxID=2234000 RepID=UPI000FDAD732|nr:hypothetical protein [Halobacteriovorax sp. HLS]
MKSIFKLAVAFSLLFSVAAETGLSAGDQFLNHRLEGNITILCSDRGQTDRVYVTCRDSYLTPSMRSKFVYDSDVQADKLELTYTNSRGRSKTKSSNVKDKESSRNFNLWIGSLTQRPLLKPGHNELSYKLLKGKNVTEQGTFTVNVDPQPVRYCPYRSYYSSSASDCRNASLVCGRYFREHNDCQ